jgi:ATP-binding cassette subfamily B protein
MSNNEPVRIGSVLRAYRRYLKPYAGKLSLMLVLAAASPVLDLVPAIYYKRFFDALAQNRPGDSAAAKLLFGLIVVAMVYKLLSYLAYRALSFMDIAQTPRLQMDMDRHTFSRLLGHSYGFFTNNFSGSLVRKLRRFSKSYETLQDTAVWWIIPLVVTMVFSVAVLANRDWRLGTVTAAAVAVSIVGNILFSNWKLKYDAARSAKDSETSAVMNDAVGNSVNIKLFAANEQEGERFGKVREALREIATRTWRMAEWNYTFQGAMGLVIEFAVMAVALNLWSNGKLTLGDFALIQTYIIILVRRSWDIGRVMRKSYEAVADAGEAVAIMETPYEVADKRGAGELAVAGGEVAFSGVDFCYNETRRTLDGFSLRIAPGEKVALVGPSGAGKSTVVKLLLRFMDVQAGSITIDGQDIAGVTQDSLRRQIGFVPQDPALFHRTLMENIRYGRPAATDEEVVAAAMAARCHDFISALPQGYDTYVGERGIKLSGGERQRVAIARAMLKNAPILVLDEATSSLDSESEQDIQAALQALMAGKTSIAIAHRLSTIMQMDRIVVMEAGRIVDQGTHAELLARAGLYQKLWSIQAGGFLGGEESK